MLAQYHTILFDADRTLFDTAAAEELTLRTMMERIGVTYLPSMNTDYVELHEALWQQLERGELTRQEVRHLRFLKLLQLYDIDYDSDQFNEEYAALFPLLSTLMEGALETCHSLWSAGKRLAVITNGSVHVQEIRFGRSPIMTYLEEIFPSEALGVSKPDPEYFRIVLNKLKITDKSGVLIVGDSLTSDILGGNRSGIDTCWFHAEPAENTEGVFYRYEITDLRQLLSLP